MDLSNEEYDWYNNFVIDSGKKVRPELLSPKSHPDGLCAPCCFKFKEINDPKNIEKCIVHSVNTLFDISTGSPDETISNMALGSQIVLVNKDDIDLTGDSDETGVFKISGGQRRSKITKFTDIEIQPIHGMIFSVEDTGILYKYEKNKDSEKLVEDKTIDKIPKSYIFGGEKCH